MKKHQPALLQKYIPLSSHSVGLASIARHDSGGGTASSRAPSRIRARSASLTSGCSAGLLRKKDANASAQHAPSTPKARKAPRQPNTQVFAAMSGGASAPPQRPHVQS